MVDKVIDIFANLFQYLFEWIVAPFANLKSIHSWVYGEGAFGGDETDLAYGVFTNGEILDIYQPGMNVFVALAVTGILIGIIIGGGKVASAGINPANRTFIFSFMKDLAIVAIGLFNLSAIYSLVFGVNYLIIGAFRADSDNFFSLPTSWEELEDMMDVVTNNGVIGLLLIGIVLLGLSIWATFYYQMRKITLLILMIVGPLMLALWLIPQTKHITIAWFKEFIGTVLVQSVHACLFWMIGLITVSGESDFITNTILYIIFIPTAEALRNLLGLGGGMTGTMSKAGAMMGMGALAGMYGSIKGALGDKSVTGALKGAYDGVKKGKGGLGEGEDENADVKKTVGANTGTDSGTTSTAERMLKPGEISNKMGKAVFGAAGSLAGSPMGPGGAIIGSTIGFGVGGAVGGLTGRLGAAGMQGIGALSKRPLGKFKEGFNSAFNANSMADEEIAKSIADHETAKWGAENEDAIRERNKANFPDADQATLDNMWNQTMSDKRQENLQNAKEHVKSIRSNDGKYARAQSLVDETASKLTNNWANENKDSFMDNYDRENALPPNATSEDREQHEKNKLNAWNQAVQDKRGHFKDIASDTAKKMSNAVPLQHAFLSKDDYARNVANDAHQADKDAFVKDYRAKFNSNASQEEIEAIYDRDKGNANRQQYMGAINGVLSGNDRPNAAQLAEQSAGQLTENWANANRKEFMRNYKLENPGSTDEDVEVAWQNEIGTRKQAFMSATNDVAGKMSTEAGFENMGKASISKQAFAERVATKLDNQDKKQFVVDYQNNANKTDAAIAKEYDANTPEGIPNYLGQTMNAVKKAKAGKLIDTSTGAVNNEYLTSQLATVKTNQAREKFFSEQSEKGLQTPEISQAWQKREGEIYQQNHEYARANTPEHIGAPSRFMANNPFGTSLVGKLGANTIRTVGGIATGAANATYASTIGAGIDIAKGSGALVKDSKVVQGLSGIKGGFNEAFSQSILETNNSVGSIGNGIVGGIKGYTKAFAEHVPQNVLGKQKMFTNAIAYGGGLLTGVAGYQKASKMASKFNPYNNSAQREILEVSEIEQMAQKIDDGDGNKFISPDAVQMVTTSDQSYIQVTDHAGQKRIVSRYASGDSGLRKNEIVYQDMSIQNGQLVQSSEPFKYDTGGNKVLTGRTINVNPHQMIANRNSGNTQSIMRNVQPLNQKVDQGSFYENEVIEQVENIRMVVSRDKSYMVGRDKYTGQEVRVSPYGKGDARLNSNAVQEIKYQVQNRKLVKMEDTVNNDISTNTFITTITKEELIPTLTNKRAIARRRLEPYRYKGFGGSF